MVRERISNRVFHDTFLIPIPEGDAPLSIDSLYSIPQPVEVDIGCGRGRFLLARARTCPCINFIGIDRSLTRLRKIDRKAVIGSLDNIRLVKCDALQIIAALPGESVNTFYVYFPDPWPKRRHHSRRLISPTFIDLILKALIPQGTIHLCTDHQDYYTTIVGLWRQDIRFVEIPPYLPSEEEKTDFELIFRSQGLKTHRCSFQTRAPNLVDAAEIVH